MSSTNLFGDYDEHGNSPEIIEDDDAVVMENVTETPLESDLAEITKSMNEIRDENASLILGRKNLEAVINNLEPMILKYQEDLSSTQKEIEETNKIMEEAGNELDKLDQIIDLNETYIKDFLKVSNSCALKLISLIKSGTEIEYDKMQRLRRIYDTQIRK